MERVKGYFAKAKNFYQKYERIILPLSFLAGFLWDNFTLQRIDLLYENLVFAWNIFLVFAVIIVINLREAGKLGGKLIIKIAVFLPIYLQFAFGNLFSGFLIFYTRAGSVLASWPFLLLLLFLLFGNEFFKKRYHSLAFQLSIFFIVLFSYCVQILPILLKRMDSLIFILSGFLALVVIFGVFFLVFKVLPEKFRTNRKTLFTSVLVIYIFFQILYFTNIIPPIPLSLKESGIYHSVERTGSQDFIYEVSFEPASFYLFFQEQSSVFHWKAGERIYGFSAIFSPTDLDVDLLHRWSYYDENSGKWIVASEIILPTIIGGRDGGYRTYSFTHNGRPGKWRFEVVTERGQIVGRRTFEIVEGEPPVLETTLK